MVSLSFKNPTDKKRNSKRQKKTIVKETQNAYDVEAVQGCRAAAQAEAAVQE
jgi:hypothetical protein